MKKILIISYFFPPSNFVGGERTFAWAKYLHQYGFYPIVITRQWNNNQTNLSDKIHDNTVKHEMHQGYEVYRLPFNRNLRDKLINYPKLKVLQKALTFFEIIFSNFFLKALPFNNFFDKACEIIEKNKDIEFLIASGRPFQGFFIGSQLKKKFEHICWIPDYRDEWTTHQLFQPTNKIGKFIHRLEKISEKKWTKNAECFIGVGQSSINSISSLIHKKGIIVRNGYEKTSIIASRKEKVDSKDFVISYSGTLYAYQEIEIVISALKKIIQLDKKNICLKFIGINMIPDQERRVSLLIKGFENNFELIDRCSKEELSQYLNQTDLLLLTGYKGMKGWYPVKLFEYYYLQKPILLCPSDQDIMEEFITQTNSGHVANSLEECYQKLLHLIEQKEKGEISIPKHNEESILS